MGTEATIIYNIAGGLPGILSAGGARKSGRRLQRAGLEGSSTATFRTPRLADVLNDFPPPHLFEDAWNPGPIDWLPTALLGGAGDEVVRFLQQHHLVAGQPALPKLQDVLAFPGFKSSRKLLDELMKAFPKARFGAVTFEDPRFPERTDVHITGLFRPQTLPPAVVLDKARETGKGLLYDPTHLIDMGTISLPGEPTRQSSAAWEKMLEYFTPEIVGVDIHFENLQEAGEFIGGNGYLIELAARAFQLEKIGFVRIEIGPILRWQIPVKALQDQEFHFVAEIVTALKSIRAATKG